MAHGGEVKMDKDKYYKVEDGRDGGIRDFKTRTAAVNYAKYHAEAKEVWCYDAEGVIDCVWRK